MTWLPWILIADQLFFATSDPLCGQHMDFDVACARVQTALTYERILAGIFTPTIESLYVDPPQVCRSVVAKWNRGNHRLLR